MVAGRARDAAFSGVEPSELRRPDPAAADPGGRGLASCAAFCFCEAIAAALAAFLASSAIESFGAAC